MIGRRGQKDPINSFKEQAPGKPWYMVGWIGLVAETLAGIGQREGEQTFWLIFKHIFNN